MEIILSNESFKIWVDQFESIKGVELPKELELALYLLWFEHVGIFIIPERNLNGWVCKIQDVGMVQLSAFNVSPMPKTRTEAVEHAIEIAIGLLR